METALKQRGGRPRKDSARDKSGRIDWWAVREDAWRPTAWNAWREKSIALGMDPRLATQRGKMFFLQELTGTEVEAADRWAEMLERRDMLVLGRRRSPAPPMLEKRSHGESSEYDPERIERFKAAFDAAHQVVLLHGKVAEAYLNRLCRDEASSAMLPVVKETLGSLAAHYGLTPVGKKR